MADPFEIGGLSKLQRDLSKLGPGLERELRVELLSIAEPVKERAEQLAGQRITNMLSPTAEVDWWRMRLGVTRNMVYVAPKQRGTKRREMRRPNLAGLLERDALQPAVDEAGPRVFRDVQETVDKVTRRHF